MAVFSIHVIILVKADLKEVIKRKGVQAMELTFGIDLLPQLSSS